MKRFARTICLGLLAAAAGCEGGKREEPIVVDPAPPAIIERSLFWAQTALLDDPAALGLARLTSAFGNGGTFVDGWFRRFATTPHSARYGPALLLDGFAATHGADPAQWDLNQLPFKATAVHNRVDLLAQPGATAPGHCGQLRVSYASTDPAYQPFHLIFLFQQPLRAGDQDVSGLVHCRATARRWALLSALTLDDAGFEAEARAILDEILVPSNALLAESLEQTVSPWEWRQWTFAGGTFDNPPMFQTVDIDRMNLAGATRDAFLLWVRDNAASIDARLAPIPETYRGPSARIPASVARVPLDLTGLDPTVAASYPDIRKNLEIVGCPVCHTADAEFVQTRPDRTASPFYEKELEARRLYLDAVNLGETPVVPFGPLQANPILPL